MPDPYDYYRTDPQAQANPWALSGGYETPGAPSASLYGGYRKRAGMGNATLGTAQMFTPAGPLFGLGTGLFEHLTEDPKSLTTAKGWADIGAFGMTGNRDQQRQAEERRRNAVEMWRTGQLQHGMDALGQYGGDVRGDLGGELRQALYTGGEMGDMDAIKGAMTQYQQRVNEYMLGRQRAGQARQVDAMFADPARANAQAQRLTAARNQGMGQLAEQYRIGQRDNAFNQARRGMQGSSVDVEAQGDNARQRDIGAAGLQAGLEARAQQYRMGDQQQRSTLMGMIYADDPHLAAQFSNTLQGIGKQGALVQENSAIRQQGQQQRDAAMTGYSQAFGGLLTDMSKPVGYYVEHQGGGA